MGRILRYDGVQDDRDKLVFIIGTAPRYETTGNGIKYLPNSGAIVEEFKTYHYEKAVVKALRPWLDEAIVNHALSERPEQIDQFSKEVATELQGVISYKTIQRILERSGRFTIDSRSVEGNNKPKKIIEWAAYSDVESIERIAALLAD
jgi:hypothetical protein